MGQAKQRYEKRERLYEATRGSARVLKAVRPLAAQAFLLVVLVSAPRRERYEILDYHSLQQTADAVAAHLRENFPDERFCLVAFPALYPLYGLYEAEEGTLAFETRAQQAALAAGIELNTLAWCMERAVVTELDQAAPQLQVSDMEFEAAVLCLCYLPVVVIGELPLSEALREASGNLTTRGGWALSKLTDSQNQDVGCVGLFPGDHAQPVYEMLACEALATRIARAGEAVASQSTEAVLAALVSLIQPSEFGWSKIDSWLGSHKYTVSTGCLLIGIVADYRVAESFRSTPYREGVTPARAR